MRDAGTSAAILFIDISGSTSLYERRGDTAARQLTAQCIAGIADVVQRWGGAVIKTMGDGLMCTFPTPDAAFEASVQMMAAQAEGELSIYVGGHYGPVIWEDGDVFGDAVNLAARVAALAKAGEVLFSEATVSALSPDRQDRTRWLDQATVKGKAGAVSIFSVILPEDDVTTMSGFNQRPDGHDEVRLVLIHGGREIALGEGTPGFVIGRDRQRCDLAIDSDYASRQHASIEVRRGKAFLRDHSTNGTYVSDQNEDLAFVKRELLQLVGSGSLSLGRRPDGNREGQIRYRLESGR